jgi:hypothetical protein
MALADNRSGSFSEGGIEIFGQSFSPASGVLNQKIILLCPLGSSQLVALRSAK